jgi:phosphomethylpyrimidine synthase
VQKYCASFWHSGSIKIIMTRVEQAKAGIITDEMRAAASKEGIPVEKIREGIANGTIVLVRNRLRSIEPLILGTPSRIKINANIGTSSSRADISEEVEKMHVAVSHGADAIMDLSTSGDLEKIRKVLINECPVAIGTVPFYEMALRARSSGKSVLEITADDMFAVIEDHCRAGVDFDS